MRGEKEPHTSYVLDEPTVWPRMAHVEQLIRVLHRLVEGGHNVVVIAEGDWGVGLGPEGGVKGGAMVAWSMPGNVGVLNGVRPAAASVAAATRLCGCSCASAAACARP